MIYVVTHRGGYEDNTPVASFRSLSAALDYAGEQAAAHAKEETQRLRQNYEDTITRYHDLIARHGPDHVPDELTVRTASSSEPPDPWDSMTLAERLRTIEHRGPGAYQARPIEGRAGYTAGYDSWEITSLEDQDEE